MSTTETNALRFHWGLDPEIAFLNHGSFGACPTAVLEAQRAYRDRLEREPVTFMMRELDGLIDGARAELAAFLGAEPGDLAFVGNATTGVNAVLRSLELKRGDEILVTDHGYNACSNAVKFVCERAGAKCIVAKVPFPLASPDEVVDAILSEVTPHTRLALVDHVTSPTAMVFPIERIVRELASRGVETLVDGAHAPGMLELDLAALGAAYYAGHLHKWVCAPKGAAFLYVRSDLRESVRPVVISHGANSPREGRSRFHVEFDWVGTTDPTAWIAVKDTLRFFESVLPGGWTEVRARNRALALEGRDALLKALDVPRPIPDGMVGSIASVPLPDGAPESAGGAFDTDPWHRTLFEEHGIEVPIFPWPGPPTRLVRISAQLYNSPHEYQRLAEVLAELAQD